MQDNLFTPKDFMNDDGEYASAETAARIANEKLKASGVVCITREALRAAVERAKDKIFDSHGTTALTEFEDLERELRGE
jgi:hypothetical protein